MKFVDTGEWAAARVLSLRASESPFAPPSVRGRPSSGAVVLAVLFAVGCAEDARQPTIEPSGITETGFLRACDVDADCGGVGSCLCGVCSTPCGADDVCGEAACVTADRAPACAPAGLCAARCDGDDDCGAGLVCVDGACVGRAFAGDAGIPPPDLGAPDAGPGDADLDAAPADTGADAAPPACAPGDCDDGDPCTRDVCDPVESCRHPPVDRFCVDGPVTCEDPLSRRFADLLEVTAQVYEERLAAGELGGNPAPEAATRAVRDLSARASSLARRARTACLTPEEVQAGLEELLPAQRVIADLLEIVGCRVRGYLERIETAVEPSAALLAQWEVTELIARNGVLLPLGNVKVAFVPARGAPLTPGEPFPVSLVVENGMRGEAAAQPIEVEATLGCAGRVDPPRQDVELDEDETRELSLRVTLDGPGPCPLEVVARARRKGTAYHRATWTLAAGVDPMAPPRLQRGYGPRVTRVTRGQAKGQGGVFVAFFYNASDAPVRFRFTHHVVSDAVGADGWTPTAAEPDRQSLLVEPGSFGVTAAVLKKAEPPIGATGVVRIALVAEGDVPLDPPPTIDLPFEIVLGGAGCGTCEAADCDDGNACTEDACDPFGNCVNRHVAAYCVEGEAACDARDSLRFAELFEAMVRTYAQRLESAFESPPSPAGAVEVDAALRRLARVASLGGAHARTDCLTDAEAVAYLDRALGAQIDLYAAVDAAGGRLWAGVACDSAGALEDVVAALGAGDLEAAYRAEWRLVHDTAVADDAPRPALPEGSATVAFPTLVALDPPAPGAPLPLEVEILDQYEFGGVAGRPHTFDVAFALDCAGWALDRDAATVVLTPGERARVPVVVTPGADSEACALEVGVTLRENVGHGPALYRLPLRLGRRPVATRLSTGLGGRRRPYDLRWNGQRFTSAVHVLVHNYDVVEHTYRIVREVVSDVEGFAVPEEPHDYQIRSFQDEGAHGNQWFGLGVRYEGDGDPVGAEVAVRVTVTHVNGEPVPPAERQTVVQRAVVVATPPPCDER